MEIGSLEYVVMGLESDRFTSDILPELNAIQQSRLIRVVDLLFIAKNADGSVTMQEVSDLGEKQQQVYATLSQDLAGLFTAQDIEQLAGEMPVGSEAVVLLLEHAWALELARTVCRVGGALFTGGMVTPNALAQVKVELAAKEAHHA